MPQQRLRVLHAIAGTQCRQINKYILKKKKNKKKERRMSGLDLKDMESYLGQHWV